MKNLFTKVKIALAMIGSLVAVFFSACGLFPQKQVHGDNLLKLSDSKLFETVYLQTLELVESFPDEETALSEMSTPQKTVYILSMFDMELQNGGLCQFFVNSSRYLAPYVDDCLAIVGAEDHRQMFGKFVSDNKLDLTDLDSFEVLDVEEYAAQTERYDFDSFDNAYYELAPLQDYIVAYIKNNISEF